jgi:hypothetical protein
MRHRLTFAFGRALLPTTLPRPVGPVEMLGHGVLQLVSHADR